MNKWKCDNCGYELDANEPPEKCPSCEKTCEFREITNYVPKDYIPEDEQNGK